MFSFFRKKTPVQLLDEKYKKLMSDAHSLSSVNRALSDKKFAEAQEVLAKISQR